MSEETKKVLEMLSEGKISTDQADKLLEKLSTSLSNNGVTVESNTRPADGGGEKPKFLRIIVDKPGRDQVNIRMPLSFANKGRRLLAVLPPRVTEKLAENGIDVAALGSANDQEWFQTLQNADINIEKGNGQKVRIFCE
jgi:hypothetical protein